MHHKVPPDLIIISDAITFFIPQTSQSLKQLINYDHDTPIIHDLKEIKLITEGQPSIDRSVARGLVNAGALELDDLLMLEIDVFEEFTKHEFDYAPDAELATKSTYRLLGQKVKTTKKLDVSVLIQSMISNGHATLIRMVRNLIGYRSEYCLSGFLLCAVGNPLWPYIFKLLTRYHRIRTATDTNVISFLKKVHAVTRKYHVWLDNERLSIEQTVMLEYITDLFNKDEYDIDFTKAMFKRVVSMPKFTPSLLLPVNDIDFKRHLIKAILSPVNNLDGCDLSQFGDRVSQWVAGGSSQNTKAEVEYMGKREKLQATKNLWSLHIDGKWLTNVSHMKPYSLCSVSPKFENGKNRELDNDCETSYAMQSYLLESVEDALGGHLGMLFKIGGASAASLRYRINKAVKGKYVWSYDFADFQLNHSIDDIKLVYEILGEIRHDACYRKGIVNDYVRIAKWVCESLYDTILVDNASGWIVRNKNGLITGSRGTAFINTVLNKLYYLTTQAVIRDWDATADMYASYHMGDDIMAVTDSWLTGATACIAMNGLGLTGQDLKLLLSNAEGELLRYVYAESKCYGYLNRSIPNIISGEWDLAPKEDPTGISRAVVAQVAKLIERGFMIDVGKWLERTLLEKHTKLCYTKDGKGLVWKATPSVLSCSVINGGPGCYTVNAGRPSRHRAWKMPEYAKEPYNEFVAFQLPNISTIGFHNLISNKFGVNLPYNILQRNIKRKAMGGLWPRSIIKPYLEDMAMVLHTHKIAVTTVTPYEPSIDQKRLLGQVSRNAKYTLKLLLSGEMTSPSSLCYQQLKNCWIRLPIKDRQLVNILFDSISGRLPLAEKWRLMFDAFRMDFSYYNAIDIWAKRVGEDLTQKIIFDDIPFDEVVSSTTHEDIRALIREAILQNVMPTALNNDIKHIQWLVREGETKMVETLTD